MNLWAFIRQTPSKLLTPYMQIRHLYSANFNQLSLLFHRCELLWKLLSLQSCPWDSKPTCFFFSGMCWGALFPSLRSKILKFPSSHPKQKITILHSQLEPSDIVLSLQDVQTTSAFPYILYNYRKQTSGTSCCNPGA